MGVPTTSAMRLFIALDLDHEGYFKDLQSQLLHKQLHSSFPHEFHLTLSFLGEVSEVKAKSLIENLRRVSFPAFELETTQIGVFPGENRINVIWLGLKDNKVLTGLKHQIDQAIGPIKEDHPFHPHITLARIKQLSEEVKEDYIAQIKKIKPTKKSFKITQFKLIKSDLGIKGPVYTDVASFPSSIK